MTELKTRNAFEKLSARTKCIEEQVRRELEALREEQQKTPEVGVRYRHSPRVQAESNLRAFGASSSGDSSNQLYTQKESFDSSAEHNPPQFRSENFYSRNHRIVLTSSKQEPVDSSSSSCDDDDGNVGSSSTEEVY